MKHSVYETWDQDGTGLWQSWCLTCGFHAPWRNTPADADDDGDAHQQEVSERV
jgi:hypothetical protein